MFFYARLFTALFDFAETQRQRAQVCPLFALVSLLDPARPTVVFILSKHEDFCCIRLIRGIVLGKSLGVYHYDYEVYHSCTRWHGG